MRAEHTALAVTRPPTISVAAARTAGSSPTCASALEARRVDADRARAPRPLGASLEHDDVEPAQREQAPEQHPDGAAAHHDHVVDGLARDGRCTQASGLHTTSSREGNAAPHPPPGRQHRGELGRGVAATDRGEPVAADVRAGEQVAGERQRAEPESRVAAAAAFDVAEHGDAAGLDQPLAVGEQRARSRARRDGAARGSRARSRTARRTSTRSRVATGRTVRPAHVRLRRRPGDRPLVGIDRGDLEPQPVGVRPAQQAAGQVGAARAHVEQPRAPHRREPWPNPAPIHRALARHDRVHEPEPLVGLREHAAGRRRARPSARAPVRRGIRARRTDVACSRPHGQQRRSRP